MYWNNFIEKSCKKFCFIKKRSTFAPRYRGVEQLVARWAHNPKVIGSSPVSATKAKESKQLGSFFV